MPQLRFSTIALIRNVMTKAHTDQNNEASSWNLVLPCSCFLHGELWIESPRGSIPLERDGKCGSLRSTNTPCAFQPRLPHMPWQGQRLIAVAFHVRNIERVQPVTLQQMFSMGFNPIDRPAVEYENHPEDKFPEDA